MELTKSSKAIQDEIERYYLHWKRIESVNEDKEIICGLR